MRVLLDTHVLIWWLRDDPLLGPKPRALSADAGIEALFSIASCWEASIKTRLGKMDLPGSQLWRFSSENGLRPLGIELSHLAELERLPIVPGHRDPFDRLLLAQAKAEGAALVTHDRALPSYGIDCIGVR